MPLDMIEVISNGMRRVPRHQIISRVFLPPLAELLGKIAGLHVLGFGVGAGWVMAGERAVREWVHASILRNSTTHTHGLADQLSWPLICSQIDRYASFGNPVDFMMF